MGGFSTEGKELIISPFPLPWMGFLIDFLPSTYNHKTGSGETSGFFGGWQSGFSGYFLLEDKLAEPDPFEVCPPCCFYITTCCLIWALLLAISISTQSKTTVRV